MFRTRELGIRCFNIVPRRRQHALRFMHKGWLGCGGVPPKVSLLREMHLSGVSSEPVHDRRICLQLEGSPRAENTTLLQPKEVAIVLVLEGASCRAVDQRLGGFVVPRGLPSSGWAKLASFTEMVEHGRLAQKGARGPRSPFYLYCICDASHRPRTALGPLATDDCLF
jgi:hypothetical protein